MITRDYHGFFIADALDDLERLIGEVRLCGNGADVEIITGFGAIRGQVMNRLRKRGLTPRFKLGNEGTILCYIE